MEDMTNVDKSDWLSTLEDLGYPGQQKVTDNEIEVKALPAEEDSLLESSLAISNELGFFGVYLDDAVERQDDVDGVKEDDVEDTEEDGMPDWPEVLGASAFGIHKTIDLPSVNVTQNTNETEWGSDTINAQDEIIKVEDKFEDVENFPTDLIDIITAEAAAVCDAQSKNILDPATSIIHKEVSTNQKTTSSSTSTSSLSSTMKLYYSSASAFLLSQLKASGDLMLYEYALAALTNMKGASTCMMVSASVLGGRLIDKVLELPFVDAVGNCASETALFMADRTSYLSDRYVSAITANDPESRHIQRLLLAREAGWGSVHKQSCFLSSLPWHQRQLLKITRNLDRKIEKAIASLKSSMSMSKNPPNVDTKGLNVENDKLVQIKNGVEEKMVRGGVFGLHHLLTDAMEEGDHIYFIANKDNKHRFV